MDHKAEVIARHSPTVALVFLAIVAAADPTGGRESTMPVSLVVHEMPLLFPVAQSDYLVLSSPFGVRVSPTLRTLAHHDGVDITAVFHAQVVAAADGIVIRPWPPPDGYYRGHPVYGGVVEIDHGGGFVTLYAHLAALYVLNGQHVRRGQVIGRIGSTGRTTGPHLHFEARIRGVLVNPLLYMAIPGRRE